MAKWGQGKIILVPDLSSNGLETRQSKNEDFPHRSLSKVVEKPDKHQMVL